MEPEEKFVASDFYLRDIPNVKLSKNDQKTTVSKIPVKAEMQVLRLSETSQKLIMGTLKHIYGPTFTLANASEYIDKGSNLSNKYWMERGNLVIKSACDFSAKKDEEQSNADKIQMFAELRLQSYGFHKNHCVEALQHCQNEVDEALGLLFNKYYKVSQSIEKLDSEFCEKDILEHRLDEKSVLESIYETAFEEKISNKVWIVKLKLVYLLNFFNQGKQTKSKPLKKNANYAVKKAAICRGFIHGNCKYGNKCRFLHETEIVEVNPNAHLDTLEFELEIRFPKNNKYPYEPPLLFLKTNAILPELSCLHIVKRLHTEAVLSAEHNMPCIYTIVELLRNEEEITDYLKNTHINFLHENEPLFPAENILDNNTRKTQPSHFAKGSTKNDKKVNLSEEQLHKDNSKIVAKFKLKVNEAAYLDMLKSRKKLPAWNLMPDILNSISGSQVVVISGETGCGKSTQVPQFILDEWLINFGKIKHVNIVCTQPRRISAIGVAERVADERVESVGNSVGYQIRLESKVSSSTRLMFCTTGILLRRLQSDPYLNGVTHIIVDEVHERSEESDFLLLILRDLLPERPDLKVILMSATMNSNLFADYFGKVPILEIPGRTFPVEQLFLEDILECSNYVLEENSQFTRKVKKIDDSLELEFETCDTLSSNSMPKDNVRDENLTLPQMIARFKGLCKTTYKNLYLMDHEKINLDLVEAILVWIVSGEHDYPNKGSILVFLPGIAEITSLHDLLQEHPEFCNRNGKYKVLPLHSTLTSEEQSAIFKKPPKGVRKIILSTNIAETSITIDDCVFVIDCGKMKEKRFDSNRNMESLELVWVSRANAMQRKGRAGRVMSGLCIHLFTSHRYEHHLLSQPVPEIQRIPLEQLLLNIKVLPNFNGKSLHYILGQTIEPPSTESIDSAIVRLHDIGALDKEQNLTPLGHHLAALPVDVRIGKLMLYGAMFCCLDAALTMAACLSFKSPFVTPFGKKHEANAKKKEFFFGNSDQITVLQAYKKWQEVSAKSRAAGFNFANENYLSTKTLVALADIKHQLLELLVSIGFVPIDLNMRIRSGQDRVFEITGPELNSNGHNIRILSAILSAALYPNVVKVLTPEKSFTVSATGAVPRQPDAKELRFKTKEDGFVFLHPSSVNATIGHFSSPYLVYQEKIKTSKIFIRDCCMVPLIPLVLFTGNDISVQIHNGQTVIALEDDWIMFQTEQHDIAEMLKMIRIELRNLLEKKIRDPLLNLVHDEKGERILSTINYMISHD